ncbi:MAG TPA: hypothetical protein VGT44_19365, partial [Ktedonobacteraceae bacterium]|nr:hypothetical protein [Ktedonobacteraceae bacterium]
DGVYMSADGGLHWQRRSAGLPTPSAIYALAFDDSGKKLFAAADTGLFFSTNAGQSWMIMSHLPNDGYSSIAFDLKAAQSIFVASRHHGLLYSSNGGLSWASISAGLPVSMTINSLTFDSNQHQLWVATDQGIYLSSNNGSSWLAANIGLPTGASINDVLPASVYGGNPDVIYAGTSQGFYLSQDQGAHWMPSQTALVRVNILAILIDVQSASTVYIATDKVGVLRSTDNGQNWSSVAPGLPTTKPVYAIVQGATNYSQLFAATNDVYLFSGTGSIFDPTRLLPLLLVVVFFLLLIRLSSRSRRGARNMLKPERIIESNGTPTDEAKPDNPPHKA